MNAMVDTRPVRDCLFEQALREKVLEHIERMGLRGYQNGESSSPTKDGVRQLHRAHREQFLTREFSALRPRIDRLLPLIADGREVVPEKISPAIVMVENEHDSLLFRLATLIWSVPVSRGYGRRMRFLVIDQANQKLMGIFALGDPVFNLKVRDDWIGWNVRNREARLVNVMDGYVIGAVPPYSFMLGGKLIASLVGSREVSEAFIAKYFMRTGLISGEAKEAKLVLATVTSALGRSSIYNRVKLDGLIEFKRIGWTSGWGHFHIPDDIFREMRKLLELRGHPYARGYRYGQGPNWRIRTIREALKLLAIDEDLLRHGIAREVFGIPLANNWREYLTGTDDRVDMERPSGEVVAKAALRRWVIPRSLRDDRYRQWTRAELLEDLLLVSSRA